MHSAADITICSKSLSFYFFLVEKVIKESKQQWLAGQAWPVTDR
jgi:hypothetical protein